MVSKTFKVNNTDYSGMVERDSYSTTLSPIYETVTTLDGVSHSALKRWRGSLKVGLNPQSVTDAAKICADLLSGVVQVQYTCLQRNQDVTVQMTVDDVSADYLSRCLFGGVGWADLGSIKLTEC